jgi:hypothetical protein
MVPTVSYKDLLRISKSKGELRGKIKENIQRDSTNISMVAEHWMCSRNTIYKILRTEDLEFEKNRRPLSCPHKVSPPIEKLIVHYSIDTGYGPDMIKVNLKLKYSTSTIYRILKASGRTKIRKKRYIETREVSKKKKNLKAFEKWQLDTKFLTDLPNLTVPIFNGKSPKYEYTLRDMKTGTTFLGYAFRERTVEASINFISLCLYHMQLHEIDTHYVTIQSDNGTEFLGSIYQKEEYAIKKVVEDVFHARFVTTPIRKPTFNSHVETFHNRVEPEFYDRIQISSLEDFRKQSREFQLNWNTKRRSTNFKKTPAKIASEYGIKKEDCFYNFPILFYDTIVSSPWDKSVQYVPDDIILSNGK